MGEGGGLGGSGAFWLKNAGGQCPNKNGSLLFPAPLHGFTELHGRMALSQDHGDEEQFNEARYPIRFAMPSKSPLKPLKPP